VQMVLAAVFFQLVGLAAQRKDGVFDAVGVAPHKSTAAGAAGRGEVVFVICHGVVTQHHIHRAVFGRDDDIFDHAAVIQHTDGHTAGVREDVLGNISALFGHTEGLGTDLCHWASPPKAFFGNAKGADCPLLHLVCIYDYITVLQFCVGFLLELPSNFYGDFLLESSKVPTIALLAARLRRKKLLYKGSILALSVISLCSMPAPPKWEPLAVHTNFISLPRPLPLGEVDLRSKDGEGEPAKIQIVPSAGRQPKSAPHFRWKCGALW